MPQRNLSQEAAYYRAKWVPEVITRRIKNVILEPPVGPPDELLLELWVLDFIEQQSMVILNNHSVPTEDQKYYIGYAKRLWALAMKFAEQQYKNERDVLTAEYVTRGWDATIMGYLWDMIDEAKALKQTGAVHDFSVYVGVM